MLSSDALGASAEPAPTALGASSNPNDSATASPPTPADRESDGASTAEVVSALKKGQ